VTPRGRLAGFGAFTIASALVLSACGGGGGGDTDTDTDATDGGATTGIVSVSSGEPQNPLIPTMTNEVYGGLVVKNLFAGLVYYDEEGNIVNEVAESIESEDNVTWTITIQDGWTFTDGSPVTAQSFVDAWNYGALLSNAQNLSYFFEDIAGFSWEEDSELALEVVDDTTFTVEMQAPTADFPVRLGYAAFFPLPESFHDDPEALGENPVGNGPYMLEAWQHDQLISVVPNPDYDGPRAPQNGGVDFVAYTAEDTAYNDLLGGNLDIITNVPASAFQTFEGELGERAVNQPAAIIQTVTVPEWLEEFQGEAGLLRRQAISHAINREQVTETVFAGTRTPATDFTSPVIPGWSEDIPGSEILSYDADEAKRLWDEAQEMDPLDDYTLQLASNADSDHQPWIDAVCNNIRTVLEIGCEFYPYPTFAEFLDARDAADVPGIFRAGWQADWPAMGNFLGPIFGTGAGSNDGQYSSEEFDAKLDEAGAADSIEVSTTLY
jgi:oligopeptide transport system substrate-binding protein